MDENSTHHETGDPEDSADSNLRPSNRASDLNQDFVRLLAVHERTIRGFVRSLLPYPNDVDDLMQEILVIAWKKFDDLKDHHAFPRWACAIARYQVLNFRRKNARDRLVLSEEIVALIADEGLEETADRKDELKALEDCMQRLPSDKRQLIMQTYQPDVSIARIADELGKTENSIYQLTWRIRQTLWNCVSVKLSGLNS